MQWWDVRQKCKSKPLFRRVGHRTVSPVLTLEGLLLTSCAFCSSRCCSLAFPGWKQPVQKAALEVWVGKGRESFPSDTLLKHRGVGADVWLGEGMFQVR